MQRLVAQLDRGAHGTWLPLIDHKRDQLRAELVTIRGYVDAADRVSQVLPEMLGQDRPQRYFIGLQNEAELRGTGGYPVRSPSSSCATAPSGSPTSRATQP